ncbi:MAG: radical SAM protein [Desulfobacterales bacterium]|nr:MAG: radical SAM protein [Desulfobacterales bacterium]
MKVALIFPPTCDPTAPYISLPSLTAWLRSHGIEVVPIDANLECTERLLQPENLEILAERLAKRLSRLERKRFLDHREQLAYTALWQGKRSARALLQNIEDAVSVLRDRSGARFFDPIEYYHAVAKIEAALRLVSAAFTPLEMDFTKYRTPFSLLDMDQIRNDARADRNPFFNYFSGHLADRLAKEQVGLVGVSVAYTSQIQQAYTLAYLLRRKLPNVYLTVGGPAMTQLFLRLDSDKRIDCLGPFHSAVLLEGEAPLLHIVRELESGRRSAGLSSAADPVDLTGLPAPDFDGLPLERYFSPFPVLPYDPTRGCYWRKCAFCHYGLAEKGTAPYRERPLETVLQHLEKLSTRHNCHLFYLSQDVMAPRTVHRLARDVRTAGLTWHWATDLRAERYFSSEVCRDLAEGGALAVALGIESGSARMLHLIRKGNAQKDLESVIQNLAAAGVAVEAMFFTDFPTESYADAMATLQLLDAQREAIALFMCGRFQLTSGSAVAAQPADFGIREIWYVAGDDLRNTLYYEEKLASKTAAEAERIEARLIRIARHWKLRHYPWAGSLSTAHTLLWYERFGPQIFKQLARERGLRSGTRIDTQAAALPQHVRTIAAHAYANEASLWHMLVHGERTVAPDLFRRLAKNLPALSVRKIRRLSG